MYSSRIPRIRTRRRHARHGSACVEAAFCLPVLFVLTLGTMDVCSSIFLKEAVTIAAYEGARIGIGRGRTDAEVRQRVTDFLDERGIIYDSSDVVVISAPGFDTAETLENVTVTVTAPGEANLLAPSQFFADLTFSASVTMRKEYQNPANQ